MDLTTRYLGLNLAHPLMPGASPLAADLDGVRRLEDAGAAAVILPSLFEEQVLRDRAEHAAQIEGAMESHAEALSYFPAAEAYRIPGPDGYLEHVRRVREAVTVPVIASLNGVTESGWADHARRIAEAGAHALELNVYHVATDPDEPGSAVESRVITAARAVRDAVTIPVAVKLSPFFSSVPHLVAQLAGAGAGGVVLFNRFYQPDLDVDLLEVVPRLRLSDSSELPLRLRWLALLSGRVDVDLAASGGIHGVADAVKAVMAGAHAVQVVSALLRNGPDHLAVLREGLEQWLDRKGYDSLDQLRGSLSAHTVPDPAAFERGNYLKVLHGGR